MLDQIAFCFRFTRSAWLVTLERLYEVDLNRPMGSWRKAWQLACKGAVVRYRPHDMRHTFISRLAENPNVSEQTIKALAGHVSRQMLERYSHIRSAAKQAAIQTLELSSIQPILQVTGHKIGHSNEGKDIAAEANSQKTNGGPARIRTWDQRIMSTRFAGRQTVANPCGIRTTS